MIMDDAYPRHGARRAHCAPFGRVAIGGRFVGRASVGVFFVLAVHAAARATQTPTFAAYPVSAIYRGKNAKPQLLSPDARMFRTRLEDAAKQRPNFAGRYILATWGCGTSCVMGAVIDAQTGRVTFLPAGVCCWGAVDDRFNPVDGRLTSKLIVLSGQLGEKGEMGSHYFVFDGRKFTKIKTIKMSDDFGASTREAEPRTK
jgi:hypothetical protein